MSDQHVVSVRNLRVCLMHMVPSQGAESIKALHPEGQDKQELLHF